MNHFKHIQEKLAAFIKKFYINELIKGSILFFAIGALYFLFTLFLESFLWLKPLARTILFWVFVLVELSLFLRFICFPLFKIFGLRKGLSEEEASKIIGAHFSTIDDKLLNVLQLHNRGDISELLEASIEQKSMELEPIPFTRAIQFSGNKKYLKYGLLPVFIIIGIYVLGFTDDFTNSYDRVVHHKKQYVPPAPYSFHLLSDELKVIQGDPLTVEVAIQGNAIPENVKINFEGNTVYMQQSSSNTFTYTFNTVNKDFQFSIEGPEASSMLYNVEVIPTPTIESFEMELKYPKYTNRTTAIVENTGIAEVPEGTEIKWLIKASNTENIYFELDKTFDFKKVNEMFEFERRFTNTTNYTISTSNAYLEAFENLKYTINVIKDEFPTINIQSDIDSIRRGPAQFYGQIADDYGISKLELLYYDVSNPDEKNRLELDIERKNYQEFFYVFPDGIDLKEGVEYEFYFQVRDNDAINGYKPTKSQPYKYYKETTQELEEQLLLEQGQEVTKLKESVKNQKELDKNLKFLQENLDGKNTMTWNDKKELNQFVERQRQYQKMMQDQVKNLQENLDEQKNLDKPESKQQKELLKERLKEIEDLKDQEKLLEELEKLADKFDKEELSNRLKKLTEQNKQNERNLERILELTKRFYVEQKANQIKDKLDALSKEQNELSNSEENNAENQEKINEQFDAIKEDLKNLDKENKALERPMDFPKQERDSKRVSEDLEDALDELQKQDKSEPNSDSNQNKNAQKKQRSAAQKMKEMSQKMGASMSAMQGEAMEEDIAMLRAILENLLAFSFDQEALLNRFSEIDNAHPDFAKSLKKQYVLQEYFEHIDDSLYALSMRQPRINQQIFKDLSDTHYFLSESLTHFTDNQFSTGLSDQQFVLNATNHMAYVLSNMLNAMQNASPSMGQGQGQDFGLPDIIKQQEQGIEQMQKGMQKGQGKPNDQNGQGKEGQGEGEENAEALYELYKQQAAMRQMLEDALKDAIENGNGQAKSVVKEMEQLENDLLEKGFTNEVLDKMLVLKHELLKLEEATYKQGQDKKREAQTNTKSYQKRSIKELDKSKLWFNEKELLLRQSLPLQPSYKKKVQTYFLEDDSI
ncbi:ATPase [Urechidicola sp. KH5]